MVDQELLSEIAEQLKHDIIDFRKEIDCTPLKTEAVSLTAAESRCAIGTTGNDVTTLLDLEDQGVRANSADQNIEKYFTYAIIIMVIGILPLMYYMVINKGA